MGKTEAVLRHQPLTVTHTKKKWVDKFNLLHGWYTITIDSTIKAKKLCRIPIINEKKNIFIPTNCIGTNKLQLWFNENTYHSTRYKKNAPPFQCEKGKRRAHLIASKKSCLKWVYSIYVKRARYWDNIHIAWSRQMEFLIRT